jgi:predicted deacylase
MTRQTGLRNDKFARKTVRRGDVAQVNLPVSETVSAKPAHLPVTIVRGRKPGPTLFVTGAVHGDEINGVAVVRRLLDALEPDSLRGTLIGVPVVNQFGFASQERYTPDRRDLNRFFPGDMEGSMASRIAARLFKEVVMISDAGIDLHTAAQGQSNLCHVRGNVDDPVIRDMMRSFGTPIALHGEGPRGSLRRAATDAGVPTIIFEAGEPSRFQHHAVEIGFNGVLRVMRSLGMTTKRTTPSDLQIIVRKSEWLRTDHGGLLDLDVEPGDLVRARQRVATIHDPFGQHVDEVSVPHGGVVISTATVPLCHPGYAIVHVGHLHKTMKRAREYVKSGGDLGHVNWVEANRQKPRLQRRKGTKPIVGRMSPSNLEDEPEPGAEP